ncbi:TPA: class I SAM-dependent methyltransferase [Raoultella planticola]
MLIDDIDFASLYQQQLALAGRKEKPPAHWDARAEKMTVVDAPVIDSYLQQLLAKIDLRGASSLFDMGCGPGTVALALAARLERVCGVDYSQGMLDIAARRAAAQGIHHASWHRRAWEESWEGLARCDIAIASRSTLVADMRDAMTKLNRQARLRVYTTHLVNPGFASPTLLRVLGRESVELPNYLYAVNVLYQMGIHASVDFIYGERQDNSSYALFERNVVAAFGVLSPVERERLSRWYPHQNPDTLQVDARDWALIGWECRA